MCVWGGGVLVGLVLTNSSKIGYFLQDNFSPMMDLIYANDAFKSIK